jgi:NNP family nitrate/nitrite transporter-like MFS transporter
MGFKFADLYRAPDVNPVNRKARSIPALNPFNPYGRVFLFSWLGFMIAFWAWYTFPPLVRIGIVLQLRCPLVLILE